MTVRELRTALFHMEHQEGPVVVATATGIFEITELKEDLKNDRVIVDASVTETK